VPSRMLAFPVWSSRGATALAFVLAAMVKPCDAENRWPDERQAGQFLCHADFPLAPQQALLDELSQLQQDLAMKLGAPPPREPVHFFLFQAKGTYQSYMKQYFPRVPYRRALFIKARGPGMVFAFQGTDFEIDVRHECTHALLHTWLPQVPLWLDEGLAEYFEVPRDKRVRQHSHYALVQAAAAAGQLPRLEELESLDNIDEMERDEYRDAWAWVHFMLHGPREAQEELVRYLDELNAGSDPGRLSERLRRRLPDLNRRMAEHFGR
jgi:Protein of unknown function (DUF1570)